MFLQKQLAPLIFEPFLVILKAVPSYFINVIQKHTSWEWMWTFCHSLSHLGIIIAFLKILQASGNNGAWCQVIAGSYIGRSVQCQS